MNNEVKIKLLAAMCQFRLFMIPEIQADYKPYPLGSHLRQLTKAYKLKKTFNINA